MSKVFIELNLNTMEVDGCRSYYPPEQDSGDSDKAIRELMDAGAAVAILDVSDKDCVGCPVKEVCYMEGKYYKGR